MGKTFKFITGTLSLPYCQDPSASKMRSNGAVGIEIYTRPWDLIARYLERSWVKI